MCFFLIAELVFIRCLVNNGKTIGTIMQLAVEAGLIGFSVTCWE